MKSVTSDNLMFHLQKVVGSIPAFPTQLTPEGSEYKLNKW